MTTRKVRTCDQCGKEITDKRIEFGGFVAIVNGQRTEAIAINETCSPACSLTAYRTLVQKVTEAADEATRRMDTRSDCHSIATEDQR